MQWDYEMQPAKATQKQGQNWHDGCFQGSIYPHVSKKQTKPPATTFHLTCLQSEASRLRLLVEMVRLIVMPANCKLLFPSIDVRQREVGCKREKYMLVSCKQNTGIKNKSFFYDSTTSVLYVSTRCFVSEDQYLGMLWKSCMCRSDRTAAIVQVICYTWPTVTNRVGLAKTVTETSTATLSDQTCSNVLHS